MGCHKKQKIVAYAHKTIKTKKKLLIKQKYVLLCKTTIKLDIIVIKLRYSNL